MAIRFVVGRAGCGKTWRCLEAVRARLRESAAVGNKLLLLVPEQASFQMERALIETPDITGYTRCEVLSFQRLAYRIFAQSGADPRRQDQTIGSLGRMMVIRRLIGREKAGLQLLGRVANKPGLVKQVAATFDELMWENIEPGSLAEMGEKIREENPLGAAKLADLARLYQGYLDYLIDDRMDPAQYLNLAAERLDDCGWLNDAEIWVDGFAGFTRQEYYLLLKLAEKVAEMEITMLVDPSASAIEAESYPQESYSLFAHSERTLARLRNEFHQAGLDTIDVVRLSPPSAPRFASPELAVLERHLFNSKNPSDNIAISPDVIRLVELPDPRSEVDAAVAEVQRLCREADPPMRYRDIAVIVRDLAAYHDLLSSAMRSHDIPFFIDLRQPTTHHPLVELIRGLLAMAAEDCRLESMRMLLKTGLLGLALDETDLLENYLLAHGINGRAAWDETWHYARIFQRRRKDAELSEQQLEILRRINQIRKKLLHAVSPWLDAVVEHPQAPGQSWAEALFACLDHLQVGEQLYQWSDAAEADGRSDEANTHRQVWIDFMELLDEFVRALSTESMGIEEFRETIESGLAEFNLGLAPATLDQVLVGAIERSRHPPLRAVILIGFDENHFPMKRSEDPLLGDAEREAFGKAGREIGRTRRQQLLDERMLAYIALTRASERIWISYSRSGADGKSVQPSPYLDDVLEALPGLEVHKLDDFPAGRSKFCITSVGELGARLAGEFRYRSVLDQETSPGVRSFWNGLYETARQQKDWQQTLKQALAGLKYHNVASLQSGMMKKIITEPFAASVSRLERFAACPFAHFAEYTLGLENRVEADLAEIDLGTLCHAILEKFIDQLTQQQQSLSDLENDEIAEKIDVIAKEVVQEHGDDIVLAQARNAFLCDRTRGHLSRVTQWQRDAARVGKFRPMKVEFPFGFSGDSAAPLKLTTPKGRVVHLRGYIDRVDVAELGNELLGTVIDYKRTTERRLDFTKVYHGLALQLVGYLLALEQSGESLTGRPIKPVAAFYLPLLEPYKSVAHPSEEKKSRYQWRGIADVSALGALDKTVEPGSGSQYMSARITKKGEPHTNSDLARPGQLRDLMRHVGKMMGWLADELLDGNVSITPYRLGTKMPCTYCTYHSVCRFEIVTQTPRALDSFKKQDVLDMVEGEGE